MRRINKSIVSFAVTTALTFLITGCTEGGDFSMVLRESAEWRWQLDHSIKEAEKSVSRLSNNELESSIARAGAYWNQSVMCGIEYTKRHAGSNPGPFDPFVCTISPSYVDLNLDAARRPRIDFFGFDLNSSIVGLPLELWARDKENKNVAQIPLTVGPFQATANISPAVFKFAKEYTHLVLQPQGNTSTVYCSVPVIQPEEFVEELLPGALTMICTKHEGGDTDFKGNGPDVDIDAIVKLDNNQVLAQIQMDAIETIPDHTHFTGNSNWIPIYSAPNDVTIERLILATTSVHLHYVDSDGEVDLFEFPAAMPIRRFVVTGDTGSDDFGKTGVHTEFNPLRVVLKRKY